jgi:PilZ domain
MEIARALVSRLRQYVGNRRRERRQTVRLPFRLSLPSPAKGLNGARRINSMEGHTLDLNATGLSLVTPKITLGEHHLVGENRGLSVKLELPLGPVEMQVMPVRYEALEDHETETGYLIGVQILAMTDQDRERFAEYVSTLPGRSR